MRFLLLLTFMLAGAPCFAFSSEMQHLYDVDLNEETPFIWRVEEEYRQSSSDYNWKYDYSWNVPPIFDKDFSQSIKNFGNIEKRLENADEELLLQDLKRLPPAFYPYIGPVLHTVPGLSGKILNLPGIKETKNQFPKHIASKLSKIPDIEFVSPELYIYLMPIVWGEGLNSREFPQKTQKRPHRAPVKIKKEFIENILKRVPTADFASNQPSKKEKNGIRHYTANATTPLSRADVKAFINTLEDLRQSPILKENEVRLISLNFLFSYWDGKQGVDSNITFLKGVVNPCQTIARKIKWLGLHNEFQQIIGKEAFGIDDWAYTCDKTLKAYRVVSQNNAYVTTLNILKKGYFNKMIDQYGYYTPQEKQTQQYFIEAVIQMFSSNYEDIKAVRPFKNEIYQKLLQTGSVFLGTPIIVP